MRQVDLPAALPDGSKLLHIGMPKSGTTALQAALHDARDQLEALGAHNISRHRNELWVARRAAGSLPKFEQDRAEKRWPKLAEEFRTSSARVTFWSGEPFSSALPDRIEHIAEMLGTDPHIVVTVRPLPAAVQSGWQQTLQRRGTLSLREWTDVQYAAMAPDGTVLKPDTKAFVRRLSPARIIEQWGALFGEDKIIFVVADPADRSKNFRVFESLLGVPEILSPPQMDNSSLPYPEAEFLRAFNRTHADHGGDLKAWRQVIRVKVLRELAKLAEPHPIRMPREDVVRLNEYTEHWIKAVEDSDATVVGDLDNLITDPERHPEDSTPPDAVSTQTAGWFTNRVFHAALSHGATPPPPPEPTGPPPPPDLGAFSERAIATELLRRTKRRLLGG